MFSRMIGFSDAVRLLDLPDGRLLEEAVAAGAIKPASQGRGPKRFRLGDLVMLKLGWALENIGVEPEKAVRYTEAILGQRLPAHDRNVLDWIENETQELFCLIADGQLARIFLRSKDDFREVDVGAVKPVLFPVTLCEVNIFRVIRPVIVRALELSGTK